MTPRSWGAPVAAAAAALVCALVAGVQLGGRGVLSALVALVVVVAFFWSGLLPVALASGREERAGGTVLVLLVNYALRLVLVLVVLRVTARLDVVDARAVGVSLVACALSWVLAQAVLLARA